MTFDMNVSDCNYCFCKANQASSSSIYCLPASSQMISCMTGIYIGVQGLGKDTKECVLKEFLLSGAISLKWLQLNNEILGRCLFKGLKHYACGIFENY